MSLTSKNKHWNNIDTLSYISSSKWVILVRKHVNLKLEWMKNYDTKPKKKKKNPFYLLLQLDCQLFHFGKISTITN